MKIAMMGPFYPEPREGGVEHHVRYLADSLEKSGVEVERWSWKVPKDTGNIRRFSLLGMRGPLRETDADLVHFHSTATAFSFFSGLGKFGNRSVATIHAFFHPELESGLRMKLICHGLAYPYSAALRSIRNNIAVSSFARKEAGSRGVPVKAVIGSGIPLGEIRKAAGRSDLESDVVLVARLNEQKGVFDFIRAFSDSGLKALMVGYGERGIERKVLKLCEKGGIRCLIRPNREETLAALTSSKVLAFPSRGETFGIVCLEAMALGKPVVAYRAAGGPLDFVEDGGNGKMVDDTPDALKNGVEGILGNSRLRSAMSKNALRTSEAYDWGNIAGRIKKFYSLVLP